MKLLSICIPTYNRYEKVINLLKSIHSQIDGLEECVDIIVSENYSTQENHQFLIDYLDNNNFIKYHFFEENVGPFFNFLYLIKESHTKFTWIFGDDDYIIDGSIKRIIKILKQEGDNIGLMHLNYNNYVYNPDTVIDHQAEKKERQFGLINNIRKYQLSTSCLADRFMFISCNIHRTECLKSAYNIMGDFPENNMCHPLFASLYSMQKGLYIDDVCSVLGNATPNSGSWSNSGRAVALYEIPMILNLFSDKLIYEKSHIHHIIFNYFGESHIFIYLYIDHKNVSTTQVKEVKSMFTILERIWLLIKSFYNAIILMITKIYDIRL